MIGKTTKNGLEKAPFDAWFTLGFNYYKPNKAVVNELKNKGSNITVAIFMGTWCSDSQEHVLHFFK